MRFTGLTWPGCSCEACTRRDAELRATGHRAPNPAMWQALLNLAKEGKFRGRIVLRFFDVSASDGAIHCKASEGEYGVYDLMPADVWRDCLARADTLQTGREPRNRIAAALITAIWLVVLGLVAGLILRAVRAP